MTNKLVDFHKWCSKCEYKKTKQTEDPCNECLTHPVNVDSHKPVCFEEKKKK